MIISLANDLTKQTGIQQTYISTAVSAGGTSSPVKNIGGFSQNWAVQIGQTGEETAEIMLVSGAPSGTQLNFGTSPSHSAGTLLYSHAQDTPLYQIHYDQIIFYRSTAGTGGAFSALATVSIQPDNPYTQYDDTTGAATYAYYAQYYNSVSGDLSGSSSIFVPGGATFYSLQKLRQRTKDKLYAAGYIRNDDLIADWINEWYELMTNAAIKVNQGYLLGTALYAFGTTGLGTVTASTFKQPVKFEVTYDATIYTPSSEIPVQDFSDSDSFATPRHAWVGDTVFKVLSNTTTAGSVRLTFAQRFTPLTEDSDEVTQTLKAYTTSCIEYCLSVAYGLDQKDAESQQHYGLFERGKADFIAEITPRDQTGIKTITISDSISGADDDLLTDYIW